MYDAREYLKLAKAIEQAESIPGCQTTDWEAWFPEEKSGHYYGTRMAKKLCGECPVQAECLTYALAANEQHGIWGGMTLKERLALKKKRVA